MNLADILAPERTHIVEHVTSRKRALEQVAAQLAEGTPYLTTGEIFSGLIAREKLGSTAIGHGVALPHARMAGTDDCVGACVRLPRAVVFDTDTHQQVDILFGLLVPRHTTQQHLDLLHSLADTFSTPAYLASLRATGSDQQLFAALTHDTAHAFPRVG